VSGKNHRRWARLGDVIAASVKIASPKGQVKKGDKVYAVIVRTHKEVREPMVLISDLMIMPQYW
jgi:large subunit ribosomal protein L14